MFLRFGIMASCNNIGPAFLINEIGPTWHPLHINFLLVYSNIYSLKFPKIQLVSKSSLVRPSLISHTACILPQQQSHEIQSNDSVQCR